MKGGQFALMKSQPLFSGQRPEESHFPKLHRAGTQCPPSGGQG